MKYKKAHLDFETQSECDLPDRGVDLYAKHPSTEATTMVWSFDDEEIYYIWYPGLPPPQSLIDHVKGGGEIWAHNATFEWYIWNFVCVPKYGFPVLKISQCYCTMSMANAMGLMGSLDGAAACAGLEIKKDNEGYRIMMMLCKPNQFNKLWTRAEMPDNFKKLDHYCMIDVKIEKQLSKRLAPLSEKERQVWILDQKINNRGVMIDVKSAKLLDVLVDREKERLVNEFKLITGNQVPTPASHAKFKTWLAERGVFMDSIAKDKVKIKLDQSHEPCPECIAFGEEAIDCDMCGGCGFTGLPPLAHKAILIRQESAKSSNAKIKMMLKMENQGRARGMFEYYGAKQTGRWAGRKIQLQNLPRQKMKFEEVLDVFSRLPHPRAIEEISLLHGNLMNVASECLRSLLVAAPGKRFLVADWSNIEGRGLAYLADEEWKIKAFEAFDRGEGADLYRVAYAEAFGISIDDVDDHMRQIGKTLELACGYQGAVGAFQMMAKTLGVKVSDSRAKELVERWRSIHPRIKSYWYVAEEAAIDAIKNKGKIYTIGRGPKRVKYIYKGSFLCCELPSGRVMYYPYPRYEETDAPWGGKKMSITYCYQDSETKKWVRGSTYGGSLVENITQGLCRDILAEAMLRLDAKKYDIVGSVHDEAIVEMENGVGSLEEFEKIMCEVPEWAKGFPIVAKGWEGTRYRK